MKKFTTISFMIKSLLPVPHPHHTHVGDPETPPPAPATPSFSPVTPLLLR
ncbi:hypothetical protein HanPI659440_Chr08g0297441 [Helianthus annuus]|nr:hypothetical protein HanPI659440_Chr08g0297441 [Helianthus annuus]